MAEADCEPSLFGWQAMDPKSRAVVLCEGEIDCMTYAQYGISALSVPFGGGKGQTAVDRSTNITTLTASRKSGSASITTMLAGEAAKEIARRLGEHRCRLVELPHKDINDCLMAEVSEDDIWHCLETAKFFDPDELCSAGDLLQETIDAFEHRDKGLFVSPWPSLNHNFKFRAGELTLVNGVNGHGKKLSWWATSPSKR